MKTDIEIAQECMMEPITKVAEKAGIPEEYLEQYGKYKAKIDYNFLKKSDKEDGKLILVTAINPTPAGEGKTTTTVGLADALQRMGKKPMVALREPSLGPVFGMKGGAAGGGYAQVVPMEDINLHFTGDFHAIGAANNLLAAMIDNHIYQGNDLNIDPRKIVWKRCVDMNDRQLRFITDGLGGRVNGVPREDGYDITVASEIMAILCLSKDIADLKERLGKIIVGYTYGKIADQKPVTAHDLHAEGAMCALLKDALKPNLVQTLEHTPAIVHGGPFANIAHGCNSLTATRMAMKLADYAITEEDLPILMDEYDLLAKEMIKREKEGKGFTFFHFMIDLTGGPCVAKRLSGCGSGTEYLAVTPWGDLYPCHQFVGEEDFLMGNVYEGVKKDEIVKEFKACNVYSKEECKKCFARFYCSGGCSANSYNFNGTIDGTYEIGCKLERKRVECALMVKAALALEGETENEEA